MLKNGKKYDRWKKEDNNKKKMIGFSFLPSLQYTNLNALEKYQMFLTINKELRTFQSF